MSYDNEWLEQLPDSRHKSVRETIRPSAIEELKALGAERLPSATDPWSESYKAFLDENPKARYYRAETSDGAELVYFRFAEKGIWFLPGRGMGIVQPKGLKFLAELVDSL